jgi:hypothetical protein
VPSLRLKHLSLIFIFGDRTMKKMLMLILVLAVASVANAWVLSYNSGVVTATAQSTDTLNDMYLGMVVDSAGILSDFGSDPCAPETAANFSNLPESSLPLLLAEQQGELWTFTDSGEPYEYPVGPWFHATFAFASGPAASTVSLYEWYEGDNSAILRAIITIPEPATMALLCIGGLFLRRRK